MTMRSRRAYFDGSPQQAGVVLDHLCDLLACFRALRMTYHTSHWQARGASFYGDHLLFQRLYLGDDEEEDGPLDEQIDVLAEKIVGYFGSDAVSLPDQMARIAAYTDRWSLIGCPHERGLQAERDVQDLLSRTYDGIKAAGAMTLGLDDFLMAAANQHEENTYLLQQTKDGRPNRKAAARLPRDLEVRVTDNRGRDVGIWTALDFKENYGPSHEVFRAVSGLRKGQTWDSGDGWAFTRLASRKASTNTERYFYKATDGQWYVDNEDYAEDWETGEQIEGEMTTYGPFSSFSTAERWMDRNFANSGGYSKDDSGRQRPPRHAVKPRGRWASDAPTAEGEFYDNPKKKETREFAETGALTNIPEVVEQAEVLDELPVEEFKRELQEAEEAPPTPEEIADDSGGDTVGTLNRLVVDTEDPAVEGAVRMNKNRMARWLQEL